MTKKEALETERRLFDVYSGILVNSLDFRPGPAALPEYGLNCPEYETLREQYGLDKLAGKGSAFQRGRRLLHHLAPGSPTRPTMTTTCPATPSPCWRTAMSSLNMASTA